MATRKCRTITIVLLREISYGNVFEHQLEEMTKQFLWYELYSVEALELD